MKCQACNAPLSIENERCPYCGTLNPEFAGHRRDMKRFTGEFLKTRSSVLKTTTEAAQKSMRIVIVCVMAVLMLLSFFFLSISWDLSYEIQKWQVSSKSEKYKALLDTYEETDDFLAFSALYNENSMYGIEEFEEYDYVQRAASHYESIFLYLTTLMSEEAWEGQHEDHIRYLCDELDYYYEFIERDPYEHYFEAGAYDQKHLDAVERITEKIENLIQLTFSATEEEMEEFNTFSSAEKQVFIERRMKEHE